MCVSPFSVEFHHLKNIDFQANPTLLAAALSKGIIELDISSLTSVNERNEPSDDETETSPSLLPQAPAYVKDNV